MNKQFMIKMMRAKQLQYQALKEVIPEYMINKITKLESDLLEVGKEFITIIMSEKQEEHKATASDTKSKVHKVTIE